MKHIRNFSIIAHVDHGKSTLADRLLEQTGALTEREMKDQVLDKMDIERERGITIKAQSVRLAYKARDGQTYQLNLIDTPGHVDFSYEVSRSLSACDGALLVVDASQGVEAQTLANVYLALDHDLDIIPVLNKIDLPAADPEAARKEIEDVIGLDASEAIPASGKAGLGIDEILDAIVTRIRPPTGDASGPLKALIFDSWFDSYRGAASLVRVFDGEIRRGMRIQMMSTRKSFEVQEVGVFTPHPRGVEVLRAGEVGFLTASVKEVADTKVGDTITDADNPTPSPCEGFKEAKPMVFAGLFPTDQGSYEDLRDALHKLALNDSAFTFEPETSAALGFGFRCGYLGLLHMEIVQERLEREYELSLITSAPTVVYRVVQTDESVLEIDNPTKLPAQNKILRIEEPVVKCTIYVPTEYVGNVLQLCEDKRGQQLDLKYMGTSRIMLVYEMPLAEIVFDFFDRLKSLTKGYASLDYELAGYKEGDLVKLDLLVNGSTVDALSIIVHKDRAYYRGRDLCAKLQELIPRQMYEVAIQAAIGSKVIARETVKAYRKDVIAKCYGGDISRKRKLLEKQKEGKRRMKQVGNVEIPQEAFLAVLKVE